MSSELNKKPLPAIKPASGLRIPQDGSSFLQTNYRLKTDLVNYHILLASQLISYFFNEFFYRSTVKKF